MSVQEQLDLRRSARRVRWLVLIVAAVMAMAFAAAALLPASVVSSHGLSKGWGAAVTMVTAMLAIASMIELSRMLREVEKGRVFALSTMRRFRRFSLLFLLCAIADVGLPPLIQVVLLAASGGHGEVDVTLSDSGLLLLTAGALMFFIARMFDEAARLDDDSRSII